MSQYGVGRLHIVSLVQAIVIEPPLLEDVLPPSDEVPPLPLPLEEVAPDELVAPLDEAPDDDTEESSPPPDAPDEPPVTGGPVPAGGGGAPSAPDPDGDGDANPGASSRSVHTNTLPYWIPVRSCT